MYWGEGNYSIPDIDDLKPKMKLTGYVIGYTQLNPIGWYMMITNHMIYPVCLVTQQKSFNMSS